MMTPDLIFDALESALEEHHPDDPTIVDTFATDRADTMGLVMDDGSRWLIRATEARA
jgi:hypothetical protein